MSSGGSQQASPPVTQAEQAWNVLHLVNDWIKHADAKAGVTLAFVGALSAVLFSLVNDFENRNIIFDVLVLLSCIALVAGGVSSGMTLTPRIKGAGATDSETENSSKSLIYFGSIAKNYTGRQNRYIDKLAALVADEETLIRNLAHQIHVNSGIANTKSIWAKRAIHCTLLSSGLIALTALSIGISSF